LPNPSILLDTIPNVGYYWYMEDMDMDTLRAERANLVKADADSYDPDARPGSATWRRNKADRDALKAFDGSHPEVVAAIRAEGEAARKVKYEALSDFAKLGH